QYDDYDSLLGKIGVQFAGQIMVERNQLVLSPFVDVSLWNEFNNRTSTSFTQPGGGAPINAFVNGVGTYGQVSLGGSGLHLGSNTSAFARADFRYGESIRGFVMNAGLRKTF